MREIFLSASVPERGRGGFDEASDPFLIQFAVRELVTICLGRRRIVWGGHPSITPMVLAVCRDFGQEFNAPVVLYQSRYFEHQYPADNKHFETVFVESVNQNREESVRELRMSMLSRPSLEAAVFIGGMEGILEEREIFQRLHGKRTKMLELGAPGGAARMLAEQAVDGSDEAARDLDRIDFAKLFYERLDIAPDEPRYFMHKI